MCRHLAYLGPPATLRSVLIDPPHGLYRQAWEPRRQRHGTVNADGFGIGWYAEGDPVPARYRRGLPIWGDPSLPARRPGLPVQAVRRVDEHRAQRGGRPEVGQVAAHKAVSATADRAVRKPAKICRLIG